MTVSDNGNVIRYSVLSNSVTDSRRIIKIGMWVGHEKHYTKHSQCQQVTGHKVMRRSSTKTLNSFSKRHSVVEVHLSYRKSRSPEQMAGSDFRPEVPK